MNKTTNAESIAKQINDKEWGMVSAVVEGENVIVMVTGMKARVWDVAKAIEAMSINLTDGVRTPIIINGQELSDVINWF